MGQKIHPTSLRIGITKGWQSRWFGLRTLSQFLREDYEVRTFLNEKLKRMGLECVEIERSGSSITVIVRTSRPGLLIGRGGTGIEDLKRELLKIIAKVRRDIAKTPWLLGKHVDTTKKIDLKLQIEEVRSPEASAPIVASHIAEQIKKRMPFRRILKMKSKI